MFQSAKILRAFVAILALSISAGCAQLQSSPAPQSSMGNVPELAGAWYQVYFDTNSAEIDERGRMMVERVAYVAKNAGPTRVTVIGRTDRVGAPPANVALSHRRANAIRDALVAAGVPASQIDTSWTGEGKQAVMTGDDFAEPRNRVVDITVVKVSQ